MSIDPRLVTEGTARVLQRQSTRQAARVAISFSLMIGILVGLFTSGVITVATVGAASVAASLSQCADGGVGTSAVACQGSQWVNGNLNGTKAQYKEGDAIPYRAVMTGLSTGGAENTLTFQWQTTKSGLHALDYITTWNREPSLANSVLPTGSDPCSGSGVSPCTLSSATTFAIPGDKNAQV